MKLYLMRHGEYVVSDLKAPLSEKGKMEIDEIASFLARLSIPATTIFHSGKLRAEQTAGLLAKGFVCDKPPQLRSDINPDSDVGNLVNEISTWDEDIVLVGHLPFMSRLTSKLVTGNENRELVSFEPGTIVCLENIQYERWLIDWVIKPRVLTK